MRPFNMNGSISRATPTFTAGFALLEVLIALVVVAIGVLGVAGLQFSAMRNNSMSYHRSQAIALAYEYSDRMRSNRLVAHTGEYRLDPEEPPATAPDTNCSTATCTGAELAEYDIYYWYDKVKTVLPSGAAQITCSPDPCTANSRQIITVFWDEERQGGDGFDCSDDAATDLACFVVSVQP